jgi:TDG/mug DNA glycosylase family protein
MKTHGFAPIEPAAARILVLGSLPSVRSVALGQYYAHPRNAFWYIMGELYGAHRELPYRERIERLKAGGVAVWDVLAASVRPGSLDADIDLASAEVNDFPALFSRQPKLQRILLNGRKAEAMFRRFVVAPGLLPEGISLYPVPSTSPAHAGLGRQEKLRQWRVALGVR